MLSALKPKKNKGGAMETDVMKKVFTKYSENGNIGAEGLLRFLHEEQGEKTASLQDATGLLNELHIQDMKEEDFSQFVINPSLNGCINSVIHQDMTQPMAQYYIFTGHNSYLTGNQLRSDSSDRPIIAALRRGVRVVELDLWPCEEHKSIKVTHGKTLCDPVDFEKCIVAIKENAFVSSEYPVCLTLEDHLTSPLQAKAAQIIVRVLGDSLYFPLQAEAFKEFPSPESLKGKIIISTKPPAEYLDATQPKSKQAIKALAKQDKEEKKKDAPVKDKPLGEKVEKLHINESVPASNAASAAEPKDPAPGHVPVEDEIDEAEMVKNPEYARLITIQQGKPLKGSTMKQKLAVEDHVKRISLAEPALEDVVEEDPELVVKFTQRNILRIYPSGLRVDSSNYDPFPGWIHGAQMVALNMQGYGKYLWMAHGFFKANGGCGYIRKPSFLLDNGSGGETFNPSAQRPLKETLKMQVIMTLGWKEAFPKRHFDLFSPPDFFTRLLVAGVPADKGKWKTKVIEDTWEPWWNEEFEVPLTVPELAVLRIEVRDEDEESKDEFEGQACLPIAELKSGYRCVQIYDKTGNEIPGVIMLFHFQHVLH